ncbi:GNAT family N-acetyltransferase [Nakamurella deserti]|uniref:GNAT family N-acetyltransferase n=1 Tax=Nakamurella deserti TaxID=2164074 RepID=UPI000DBE3E4A|nr:GNAT family N-acetyltransferase [Nakamurella deserti]
MGTVRIVGITEQDWRQMRDLRLQALADTPFAYLETFVHAVQQTEQDWRQRARRCAEPGQVGFAAIDGTRWVATMRAVIEDGTATLLSVFVAPSHRGRPAGVADALLDAIETWVSAEGLTELFLDVHADNARAQALYRRRGYAFTGRRKPYPLNPAQQELEMRRDLTVPVPPRPGVDGPGG